MWLCSFGVSWRFWRPWRFARPQSSVLTRALAASDEQRAEAEQQQAGRAAALRTDVRDRARMIDLVAEALVVVALCVTALCGAALCVALRVDIDVGRDLHVEVDFDVELIDELGGAVIDVRRIQELTVAEDRTAAVFTLGLAGLDHLRLAVVVHVGLAVDLTHGSSLGGARSRARGRAGRHALLHRHPFRRLVLAFLLALFIAVVRAAAAA